MIIQCQSCSRKFVVKDKDIPEEGRTVQCGYCSVTWHQMPSLEKANVTKNEFTNENLSKDANESLSVESIKASDGKTYKFLGSQWAELLASGKTGLFAKKKIGKELDKLTGRKSTKITKKKIKKNKEVDPSSEIASSNQQLPDIYKPKEGLGFLGYIFLLIIISFSAVGILKTFENDLINYFPQAEYIYETLDLQLEYVSETVKNIIVLIKDFSNSY